MLFPFLERLQSRFAAPPDSIKHVLDRWSVAQSDTKNAQQQQLHSPDEFRCLIAALYGGDKAILQQHNVSDDVAIRCAYYGNAKLTLQEMKAGYERDGKMFSLAVLFNGHVLHNVVWRNPLECRYLIDEGLYRRRCEHQYLHLPSLDKRIEEERRRSLERGKELYRFVVFGGVSVLVGWASIQEFDRIVTKSGFVAALFVMTVFWLIALNLYGQRFSHKIAFLSGSLLLFALPWAFIVYWLGGPQFWSDLANSLLDSLRSAVGRWL
jgi:hypothetical protein